MERLLYLLGYVLAPLLFVRARDAKAVAKRLRLAYKLVGVKIIDVIATDSGERMVILCPYRNILADKYGERGFCHSKLDRVDEGYASYLRRRNIRYRVPQHWRTSEYCYSEVSVI
jgi:hypothetical protein